MALKIGGIVLIVLGVLASVSTLNLARTQYDLNSSHDVGKLFGGIATCVVLIACGASLVSKSRQKP